MMSETAVGLATLGARPSVHAAIAANDGLSAVFEYERNTFARHFNRSPFVFRHNLVGHPLFEFPRLLQLARGQALQRVRYNAGNLPTNLPAWEKAPQTGLSVAETIEKIEEHISWMQIRRADYEPDYRALIHRCLDELAAEINALEPGMDGREGSVIISSPSAVTPFHLDHEHNFLLQIRGHKTVSVFPREDRELLPEEHLEGYFAGKKKFRAVPFDEKYQERAWEFELHPGDVLHIPSTAPHWVKNHDQTSVSFSVVFTTSISRRPGCIHYVNSRLRTLGLNPRPVGHSALGDHLKYLGYHLLQYLAGANPKDGNPFPP